MYDIDTGALISLEELTLLAIKEGYTKYLYKINTVNSRILYRVSVLQDTP